MKSSGIRAVIASILCRQTARRANSETAAPLNRYDAADALTTESPPERPVAAADSPKLVATPAALLDAKLPAAPRSEQPEEKLLDKFNTYFEVMPALARDEIEQALRIRYQVYCVENPFENAADHPNGQERDEFDPHSVHSLLIHRASGRAMGTTRLILPVHGRLDRSFAMQQVCRHPMLKRLPLHRTAEVSRFSISKEFRRRKNDTLYEGRDAPGGQRCPAPLMSLGLIQSLVRMSADHGITHWCATMEPKLLRLLAAMGIHFQPLGPPVEYHGMRQPCYCEVAPMLLRVKIEQRALWEVLTDGGPMIRRPLLAA